MCIVDFEINEKGFRNKVWLNVNFYLEKSIFVFFLKLRIRLINLKLKIKSNLGLRY